MKIVVRGLEEGASESHISHHTDIKTLTPSTENLSVVAVVFSFCQLPLPIERKLMMMVVMVGR